ncbi:hypothetical protein VTK73DRAFT_8290 [Phialemonium thermophilum]|uniref:F-box domain-containing protein n=1 Tax=Phialemonium thermophilum TaxID=223376 RepID=A0ABR3W9B9_9PEZI
MLELGHKLWPASRRHRVKQSVRRLLRDRADPSLKVSRCGVQVNAVVENLPAEIRLHILSLLDLQGLGNFVRASPVLYEQFRIARRSLLLSCLQESLGCVTADAYAVARAKAIPAARRSPASEYRKAVESLLSGSPPYLSSAEPPRAAAAEDLDQAAVREMATFYFRVQRLSERYVDWALERLAAQARPHDPTTSPGFQRRLSSTERTRIVRGMYRFHLFCELFGTVRGYQWDAYGLEVDIIKVFFLRYQPWEIEEILCVAGFVQATYDRLFNEIYWDVHPCNPKFPYPIPPAEGSFDFDHTPDRTSYLEGTVGRGLECLDEVFFAVHDHQRLVRALQDRIRPSCLGIGESVIGLPGQCSVRETSVSERDRMETRRVPLPFRGDAEDARDGLRPPLAWTLLWHDTYSNVYGDLIPARMRNGGYIFWDASRMRETGMDREALRLFVPSDGGVPDPRWPEESDSDSDLEPLQRG